MDGYKTHKGIVMNGYECKVCKKGFVSEELVKSHLQWAHNIPPREMIEGIEKLKKEMNQNTSKD